MTKNFIEIKFLISEKIGIKENERITVHIDFREKKFHHMIDPVLKLTFKFFFNKIVGAIFEQN